MVSVIDAARALINAVGILKTLGDEKRAKVAKYFDNISDVLDEFVEKKRGGEKTRRFCPELAKYAESLRVVASPALPEEEIDKLTSGLGEACKAWQELQ